jgi:ribonuclease Z
MRLVEAGVPMHSLTAQFVTHVHSDHVVDLPDVAMVRWIQGDLHPCGPLTVVAPEGMAARFVRRMFDVFDDDIAIRVQSDGPNIDLVAFDATNEPIEVWRSKDGEVTVEAVGVHHEPAEAVAYRVKTPTAVVVISGDTTVCDEVERLAKDADVLVHEACRTTALASSIAGTPFEKVFSYHADTHTLGALARNASVKHLLLTHLIPSPKREMDEQLFADDVRGGGYGGPITVGRDLTSVVIDRTTSTTSAVHIPEFPVVTNHHSFKKKTKETQTSNEERTEANLRPTLQLSHTTLAVKDIDRMVAFYTEVLGFQVTNRSEPVMGGDAMVFISQDPEEHHQIAMVQMSETGTPGFSMVDHLAFRTGSLDDLRCIEKNLIKAGVSDILPISHGNAWSLYFTDPEGNGVECFIDSPFHVAQPYADALDLSQSDADIESTTRGKISGLPEFTTLREWKAAARSRFAQHD